MILPLPLNRRYPCGLTVYPAASQLAVFSPAVADLILVRPMAPSTKKTLVASAFIVASVISAPLLYWFRIRELFFILAAYHVLDVPLNWLGWLRLFSWAAHSIPFVWLACFTLSIFEFFGGKRALLLATYVSAPFVVTGIYWVAWQVFIEILVRRQMHSGFWG